VNQASVLIIDTDEESQVKQILNHQPGLTIVGCTSNLDVAFTLAERSEPDIILFNIDIYGEEGFKFAEGFGLEFTASSLVLMSSTDNKRLLQYALKVGAKDVLRLPADRDILINTIYQVLKYDRKRRELFSIQKKNRPQFKIITVFNTKGGVGKGTVSLNLAVAIQQLSRNRVALVDLDLFSGNLAVMAGVTSKPSIKDMVDDISSLDKETIDSYCVKHRSGLKIVPAPMDPEFAEFIKSDHIEIILKLLSQVFNYVVVDAPTYFSDAVIPALEMAEDIVLVTTQDLAAIQNMKQCLDLLNRLSMRSKARIIINRAGYSGHLKIKDLENQLGLKIFEIIPSCEKEAIEAVNLGEPLILLAKNSPVVPIFKEMAKKIISSDKGNKLQQAKAGK
jgi:pilus assembly protein CpaE